jgi:hypothetical protein
MRGILIPKESLNKKHPIKKYWLWGNHICPECHAKLNIHWDKPQPITLTFSEFDKKTEWLSFVSYKCPNCEYNYADYDCYYQGAYIPSWYGG